jgi:hypothetical protein
MADFSSQWVGGLSSSFLRIYLSSAIICFPCNEIISYIFLGHIIFCIISRYILSLDNINKPVTPPSPPSPVWNKVCNFADFLLLLCWACRLALEPSCLSYTGGVGGVSIAVGKGADALTPAL